MQCKTSCWMWVKCTLSVMYMTAKSPENLPPTPPQLWKPCFFFKYLSHLSLHFPFSLSVSLFLFLSHTQDLEHFISSFNALMEHTSHVEQQLRLQHEANDPETAEEVLTRHIQLHDQLKKAPQNTIREGNELLRSLEQVSMHMCVWEREGWGERGRKRFRFKWLMGGWKRGETSLVPRPPHPMFSILHAWNPDGTHVQSIGVSEYRQSYLKQHPKINSVHTSFFYHLIYQDSPIFWV